MWGASELRLAFAKIKADNLIGFGVDKSLAIKEGKQAKTKVERLKRFFFNNEWLIIQLYHEKVIQGEFWNEMKWKSFFHINANTNQN